MLVVTDKNNQFFNAIGVIDGTTQNDPNPPGPTYINNATGTIQIVDALNSPQVIGPNGATSLALQYIPNSNGNYRSLITSVFNATPGLNYWAIVDLISPNGGIGHWELPLKIAVRRN
jgi:hypothetical protein